MKDAKLNPYELRKAMKLRLFIDVSSRTWLRPPYFDCGYIAMFTTLVVMLLFGFLTTRIGHAQKVRNMNGGAGPWLEANIFIGVVSFVFVPVSIWFCFSGWKRQAMREKRKVRKMMNSELKKLLASDRRRNRSKNKDEESSGDE